MNESTTTGIAGMTIKEKIEAVIATQRDLEAKFPDNKPWINITLNNVPYNDLVSMQAEYGGELEWNGIVKAYLLHIRLENDDLTINLWQ